MHQVGFSLHDFIEMHGQQNINFFITFGRKLYKIQATFNLHPKIKYGFHRTDFNPLNPELNPIYYLLALLAHNFLHVSRIRVKSLTLRLLMSYIYGAPILDVSRSHTTMQNSW